MFTRTAMITLLGVSLMFSSFSARGLDVTQDGKPTCSIVISPMASPSARLAAEELTAYVKKISGAELSTKTEWLERRYHHQPSVRHETQFTWEFDPKVTWSSIWKMQPADTEKEKPATERHAIVIGSLENLSSIPSGIKRKLDQCENDEAFYIKTDGDYVFVIGKNPIGALYGTYTLLESYMGVRWLHPGELGEHCPKAATLTLPAIDDFQQPDMSKRYQRGGTVLNAYDVNMWAVRNKMVVTGPNQLHRWFSNGSCSNERARFLMEALNIPSGTRGGHNIWLQAVPIELFDEHPEYFPLKDGERKRGEKSAGGMQRCISNPDVIKLVAEDALLWCNADPKNSYSLDASDSRETWCDCEECRAMGTVNGQYKITNLYHAFASQVMDYVLERNPDAHINVMFYIDKCYPPDDKSIRYEGKNVSGTYCTCWPFARCYAHSLTDPDCLQNTKCFANMKKILEVCPTLYTFEYLCNSAIAYAPVWKTTAQDIKDMQAIGYEGYMDIVHAYKWRPRWLSLYLGAKLQWDTDLEPETLRQDAYATYYGAAAPAMTKYHDLRLKLWENAPGHAFYGGPQRQAYCLTVPGAEKELREYLAKAQKLAGDDTKVLKRISLDETFLEKFWKAPAEELKKRFSSEKQIIPERIQEEIVIDGDLSESAWVSARPVDGFFKLNTDQPPSQENSFRVAYDDNNLYIAFVAMNDKAWSAETAKMEQHDGKEIWSDDRIELQFAPPSDDGRFYHICVNTKGRVYDSMMIGSDIDIGYDSQAEVKVKKLADRFIYELRLPLAPMKGEVSPGKVWGMYALRGATNLQPPNTYETCSLDGNYPHRVMEFRQVVFGKNVIKNGNFSDTEVKKKATRQ